MTPLHLQVRSTDRGFERLYRRHAPDVYRYALAVLRNPDDAEDVTQTTFMNAYRAFQNGERPKTPQNWLITIAHNVCRQRFRLASRRPSEVEFDEEITAAVPSDDGPSAGDIRRALGHLAFNQRAALVMRELEGRSYAEIAGILGLSVSAVETLIFRARRALREQLEEALTCDEAEFAISRQLDGRLPRSEKGRLRAHLRACEDCAAVARSQRAQRSALRGLAGIPLPASIASFFGGGGGAAGVGAAGMGIAAKVALLGTTAVVAAGVGYEGIHHKVWHQVVSRGQVAQAGRPVSGAVGQPTTKLPSDLRPPSHVAGRAKRAHHRAAKAVMIGLTRATRPTAAGLAPVFAKAVAKTRAAAKQKPKPKPRPASARTRSNPPQKAKATATPRPRVVPVSAPAPTPPAATPPASPPPAAPMPASKHVKADRGRHRHHHRAVVAASAKDDDGDNGDDDDRAPVAAVAPKPHKPWGPHRGERHRNASEAKATVKARVRVHEHHHRATPPPPPPPPAQAVSRPDRHRDDARRHDGGDRHDHEGDSSDRRGGGKRHP